MIITGQLININHLIDILIENINIWACERRQLWRIYQTYTTIFLACVGAK